MRGVKNSHQTRVATAPAVLANEVGRGVPPGRDRVGHAAAGRQGSVLHLPDGIHPGKDRALVREDDRDARTAPLDHPAGLPFRDAVERTERFVQHQQVGVPHDGAGEGQPPEFPAGEVERVVVPPPEKVRPEKHVVRGKPPGTDLLGNRRAGDVMLGELQQEQRRQNIVPPDGTGPGTEQFGEQKGESRFPATHRPADQVHARTEGAAAPEGERAAGEDEVFEVDPHRRTLHIVG